MDEKELEKGVQNEVQLNTETPAETVTQHAIQRVEKGHFKKGVSANPSGKPKGASTKKTERLKMLMDGALSEMWPKYMNTLRELDGKEFANEYRALMEFRMPRLARLDSTSINLQATKEQQTLKIGDNEYIIN
jgi:hypothetical protein